MARRALVSFQRKPHPLGLHTISEKKEKASEPEVGSFISDSSDDIGLDYDRNLRIQDITSAKAAARVFRAKALNAMKKKKRDDGLCEVGKGKCPFSFLSGTVSEEKINCIQVHSY